jgi:Tol biopolymer transport system component
MLYRLAAVVWVLVCAGCGRLGFDPLAGGGDAGIDGAVPLGAFSAPEPLAEVSDPAADDDDPSLTADMLELYFDSNRPGGMGQSDIYVARRASADDRWGAPELVTELSSGAFDSDPHISPDGLALYFNSNRPSNTGQDGIFVTRRTSRQATWDPPQPIVELTTGNGEFGPAVTADELILVFGTTVLFESRRASTDDPWGSPVQLAELASPEGEGDAGYAQNGLVIVFGSLRTGDSDLFIATRPSRDQPFSAPEPLSELATPARENDPWISDDLRTIVFSSTRGGTRDIYQATR